MHNQNTYLTLFNTDRSHTMTILIESMRMGASHSAGDEVRPHQKPSLSLSSVLETRTSQSSGHSSINTGRLERHQIYWMWVLDRPVGFNPGVTQMYQAYCTWAVWWCWPQALAYGDTSGPAGGQQQDSPKVLCSSWSQCSAKLISTKCSETKCSQTRELECFGIKHFQIFPKHIQTTKLTKWNSKYWLPGLRLKSKAFLNNILCS